MENRERITAWVRKLKPAFVIGSPKGKTKDRISWCCSLYKLQVEQGTLFIHEKISGSSDKRLREVRELCSQDVGPSTVIPLLTVSSDESTREAEKARVSSISVGVNMRNQRARKL